jgi:septum formation protein
MFFLASTSPRRRELIKLFRLDFEFVAVEVDESPRAGESAVELVERLSCAKAEQAAKMNPDALVIAADTVVVLDDEILGKPNDLRDAERMLRLWGAITLSILA